VRLLRTKKGAFGFGFFGGGERRGGHVAVICGGGEGGGVRSDWATL
jgi:hypothetical protein